MIQRIDKIAVDLPRPKNPSPNSAAALQDKLDLLHNFFLECGARANKIRVYEMVDDPTARAAVG
jgi:Mn-containing catalase